MTPHHGAFTCIRLIVRSPTYSQRSPEQNTEEFSGEQAGTQSSHLPSSHRSLLGGRTSTAGGKLLPWQLTALIGNNQQLDLTEPRHPGVGGRSKEPQLECGDPCSPRSEHGWGSGGQYKGLEGAPLAQHLPSCSGAGGCGVLTG